MRKHLVKDPDHALGLIIRLRVVSSCQRGVVRAGRWQRIAAKGKVSLLRAGGDTMRLAQCIVYPAFSTRHA